MSSHQTLCSSAPLSANTLSCNGTETAGGESCKVAIQLCFCWQSSRAYPSAHVCRRMLQLMYADARWRMLTHADGTSPAYPSAYVMGTARSSSAEVKSKVSV